MNIRPKHSRQRTHRRYLVPLILLVFGLIAIFQVTSFNPLSRLTHLIAAPFWQSGGVITERFVKFVGLLQSKADLVATNQSLQEDIAAYQINQNVLDTYRQENEALKILLGRKQDSDQLLATIVARDRVSPYDSLVIDVGAEHGVRVGDRVLVYDDLLVGSVSKVFDQTAIVTLYSAPGIETQVVVGKTGLLETMIGRGGGNFLLRVPRDLEVAVNDVVRLPDLSIQVIGIIESINRTPTEAFQDVLIKSPVNTNHVRFVSIERSIDEIIIDDIE